MLPISVTFQGNFYNLADFLYRLRSLVTRARRPPRRDRTTVRRRHADLQREHAASSRRSRPRSSSTRSSTAPACRAPVCRRRRRTTTTTTTTETTTTSRRPRTARPRQELRNGARSTSIRSRRSRRSRRSSRRCSAWSSSASSRSRCRKRHEDDEDAADPARAAATTTTTPTGTPSLAAPTLGGAEQPAPATPTRPALRLPATPTVQDGQLASFSRFASKDPFAQQLSEGEGSSPSSSARAARPALRLGRLERLGTADPGSSRPQGSSPAARQRGHLGQRDALHRRGRDRLPAPRARPIPTVVPLFHLVSVTAHTAKISIAGGSYSNGVADGHAEGEQARDADEHRGRHAVHADPEAARHDGGGSGSSDSPPPATVILPPATP